MMTIETNPNAGRVQLRARGWEQKARSGAPETWTRRVRRNVEVLVDHDGQRVAAGAPDRLETWRANVIITGPTVVELQLLHGDRDGRWRFTSLQAALGFIFTTFKDGAR